MRIRNRNAMGKYYSKIASLFLIPMILIGGYLGGALYIIQDMTSFVYELDSDTDDFYPLEDINLNDLSDMAKIYSEREEQYHIPINLSQTILLNATTQEVVYYYGTDNAGLWTGYALASECFRYANLTDGTPEKTQCLSLVKKLVDGMSMLLAVPNGGLGPDYPGQTLARFYVSPDYINDGNYTWMFNDHVKHFNGTGIYSDWRVRLYTSKDELGGYLFGMACALKFIDDPWVQNIVKLAVGQMTEGFLDTFWQEIHGDGTPCGAHLQPPAYSQWKLLLMKMATITYPDEDRYSQLYHYYLTREMGHFGGCTLGAQDSISNYYGLPFEHNVIFALILVEDDQELRDRFILNYEESYLGFKGHRNAYFNAIYLALCSMRTTTPEYNVSKIRWDVLDQLWRFNVYDLCPFDDTYGNTNYTTARVTLGETDPSWTEVDTHGEKWQNHPLGSLYSWLWEGENAMMPNLMENRYTKPATTDMFPIGEFIWGDNPFEIEGNRSRWRDDYIRESPGVSFTLPYWILAVFDYL